MVRNERGGMGMGMGMLPLPSSTSSSNSNSNSRRNRIYFPSNPPSTQSVIGHLRSRTRLTNLAVSLILLLTSISLLLNVSNYLSQPPISERYRYAQTSSGLKKAGGGAGGGGSWDGASREQGTRSIEETIERDPRMEKLDHMVMVPGHAIWLGSDPENVQEDTEWVLEPMQKGGSVKTFIKHVKEGVRVVEGDERALLVFSGGATRPPPAPPISEAQSYLSLARTLNLIPASSSIGTQTDPLPLSMRITTEEFALDSYQNLLFSIMRFKEVTGRWPGKVTVVGYGMKRRRFELLHARAIGWPVNRFDYIGIDDEGDTTAHYAGELKYGFTPFLSSPSGCHPPLSIKRTLRNPFSKYHPYHTSNPELGGLMEWCPPLRSDGGVGEDGEGMDVYPGILPWRDSIGRSGSEGGGTTWDRERD